MVGRSDVLREVYRREAIPKPLLWALAADGMHAWYAMLRRGLEAPLGTRAAAEAALAEATTLAYARRYEVLRESHPELPTPRPFESSPNWHVSYRWLLGQGALQSSV